MDINEVKEIIKMIDTSSIGELKIETSDFKMELKRQSGSSGNQGNNQNNEKNKNSGGASKDENSNNESKNDKSENEDNKKSEGNMKNKDEEKKSYRDEQRNSGDSRRESCDERREESYDRYSERPGNVMNNIHVIKSPIVGTYYASPTPYEPPLVKVGSHVRKGDVLCIIEAMKLMNEIKSDVDGEVGEVHVKNEKLVEYGQPLFTIRV